jgi:hypothetical protein
MNPVRPPAMGRSRSQLAGAYAPHHPFTFEGGEGACLTIPADGNPEAALKEITRRTIAEQIQEYCEAWAARATQPFGLRHPVALEQAVDRSVISGDAVRVRYGDLVFQTPNLVGYVPFPLAFVCRKCGLHRSCRSLRSAEQDYARFQVACPSGERECADDWQQLDVVMTHWSGDLEPLTPAYRYWASTPDDGAGRAGEVRTVSVCSSCNGDRFFLRRPPGAFAGWYFECVACRTPRPILQRDRRTLELLGPWLQAGQPPQAFPAEINMEPISYRASAVHYTHGDRLLVFDEDRWLGLLAEARAQELGAFLASQYRYPATPLSDENRERILREEKRQKEWEDYQGARAALGMLQNTPGATQQMMDGLLGQLRGIEAGWNATVFAGRQEVAPGIAAACTERRQWVRRYDFVRMAAEHKTLAEETLHSGRLVADGKRAAVAVDELDPFLKPDGLAPKDEQELKRQLSERLRLLGIAEMRLLRDVRVCEYTFGYTRTESRPTVKRDKLPNAEMPVKLRLHGNVRVGDRAAHPVLCIEQANEGFYVRLDEETVGEWLERNDIAMPAADPGVALGGRLIEDFAALQGDERVRFSRFLDEYRRERSVPRRSAPHVFTLLHTAAHHLITVASAMSGLDLGSFGEHLFVPDLAFIVYRRGTTMDLGNLSSMWRERGHPSFGNEVLEAMVLPSSLRCGSESVCNHRGGACPDCILIPESTCLTRNELLSRSVLVGRGSPRWDAEGGPMVGYYDVARERLLRAVGV